MGMFNDSPRFTTGPLDLASSSRLIQPIQSEGPETHDGWSLTTPGTKKKLGKAAPIQQLLQSQRFYMLKMVKVVIPLISHMFYWQCWWNMMKCSRSSTEWRVEEADVFSSCLAGMIGFDAGKHCETRPIPSIGLSRFVSISIHVYIWSVVYLPLWKIWVRQMGVYYSQYMEQQNSCSKPPTRYYQNKTIWGHSRIAYFQTEPKCLVHVTVIVYPEESSHEKSVNSPVNPIQSKI